MGGSTGLLLVSALTCIHLTKCAVPDWEPLCRVSSCCGRSSRQFGPRLGAMGHLDGTEIELFTQRDLVRGRRTTAPVAGCVCGISGDGALLVDTPMGRQAVRSGSLILEGET